jgi:hypothetical protein
MFCDTRNSIHKSTPSGPLEHPFTLKDKQISKVIF